MYTKLATFTLNSAYLHQTLHIYSTLLILHQTSHIYTKLRIFTLHQYICTKITTFTPRSPYLHETQQKSPLYAIFLNDKYHSKYHVTVVNKIYSHFYRNPIQIYILLIYTIHKDPPFCYYPFYANSVICIHFMIYIYVYVQVHCM